MIFQTGSKAKATAQSTYCLNNLKQLQTAWKMYEGDHDDLFPPNISRTVAGNPQSLSNSWVLGNAQLDTDTTNIINGSLYSYAGSTAIYRCAADHAMVTGNGSLPHTRSYSVNAWLGSVFQVYGQNWPASAPPGFILKTRESLIITPSPSDAYAFIDDNERTIDDGLFIVGTISWYDYPADRHGQGANLSFLDGHEEHKRWADPKLGNPPPGSAPRPGGDATDHEWLIVHSPTQ